MKPSVEVHGRSFTLEDSSSEVRYVGRLSPNVEGALIYHPPSNWKPSATETNPFLHRTYSELGFPLANSPEEGLVSLIAYAECAERRFQTVRDRAAAAAPNLYGSANGAEPPGLVRRFWLLVMTATLIVGCALVFWARG